MLRNDRQHITAFSGAANGQGSSPSEGKRKRRPEDDRNTGTGRRDNPFTSTSLGRDDLRNATRSNNKKISFTDSVMSSTASRAHSQPTNLAKAIFPAQTNSHAGRLLEETNPDNSFTLVDDFPSSSSTGAVWTKTTDQPSLAPSDEINRRMSGSGEKTYPMGSFFDKSMNEVFLNQTEAKINTSVPSHRGKSSPDPIDIISNQRIEINVDDDDDDDDDKVVETLVQPETQTPRTPTGKTQFRSGHVKEIVQKSAAKQGNLSQQTITSYAQPHKNKPTSSTGRLVGLTQPAGGSPGRPQSQATLIQPGFTRDKHTGVSHKMKGKTRASQPGLILASVGSQPAPKSTPKDTGRPFQSKINSYPSGEIVFDLQEWFCGSKRHEGKGGRIPYMFYCGPQAGMVSLRAARSGGQPLVLMAADIEYFEVVEAVDNDANAEVFMPALHFKVTDACVDSLTWERVSNGDKDPRVLIVLGPGDDIDLSKWRLAIDRLASVVAKNVIKANAMESLIKQARGQQSRGTVHPNSTESSRNRPRPKIKPAKADDDITEYVPAIVPPNMSEHSMRTRNKAGAISSKSQAQTPPSAPLPAEDLDEIVLAYPSTGPGAVNINRAELLRLADGEFLNDTLIELGLKLWLNELREKNSELVDQIHVFNSFFFKKLDGGRGRVCDYNSVKKWTSKIDLFKKRFIIVPINEHLHWYLAIIFLPEHALHAPPPQPIPRTTRKTRSSNAGPSEGDGLRASQESEIPTTERSSIVELDGGSPLEPGHMEIDTDLANRSQQSMVINDTEMDDLTTRVDVKTTERPATPVLDLEDEELGIENQNSINAKKCWILVFDSLKGKHARTIRILREYLQAEAQERHGKLIETKDAKLSGGFVEDKHLPVPEQPNWCDCGVYLLHYVEAFVANPLELLAVPGLRRKSSPEEAARYNDLWRTADVVQKRHTFRSQIIQLSEAWRQSKSQLAQVSKDNPPITGELAPDTHLDPSLPSITGELSVIEIAPPNALIPPNEPIVPAESEEPARTGELPPIPTNDQILLEQPLLFPPFEQDEAASVAETSSVGDETRYSEEPSSVSGHKIRRGKKGGERHSGSGWHSKSTQISQASQVPEMAQLPQPTDASGVRESPEL